MVITIAHWHAVPTVAETWPNPKKTLARIPKANVKILGKVSLFCYFFFVFLFNLLFALKFSLHFISIQFRQFPHLPSSFTVCTVNAYKFPRKMLKCASCGVCARSRGKFVSLRVYTVDAAVVVFTLMDPTDTAGQIKMDAAWCENLFVSPFEFRFTRFENTLFYNIFYCRVFKKCTWKKMKIEKNFEN